jgi:hypothetical protein
MYLIVFLSSFVEKLKQSDTFEIPESTSIELVKTVFIN